MIIETDNIILKPITPSDFDPLYKMYTNPNVMKYIYDGRIFSKETATEKLNGFVQHWKKHGFGMYLLQLKNKGHIAGYAGLRFFEDERPEFKNEIELGYIIDEPYWGKGYASEAVTACVNFGIHDKQFERILATILPENIASQKVSEKAGLKHTFDAEFDGLLHYIYEIK